MRICLVNAAFDRDTGSPDACIGRYWHAAQLARALGGLGHDVHWLQAFRARVDMPLDGAALHMVDAPAFVPSSTGAMLEPADFSAMESRLSELAPDVVHLFGVTSLRALSFLDHWSHRRPAILSASFHGGAPPRNPFSRRRQRRAMRSLALLMFPSDAAADRWRAAACIAASTRVEILPEVSSPFAGLAQPEARARIGIQGAPLIAWSGHLNASKDPLTALGAFAGLRRQFADARMAMAYQSAPLIDKVRARIDADERLRDAVCLLGSLPHSDMEALFSAADIFLLPSRREYGGNSLVEAMSCGAVPVVSDIPSFRTLTAGMRHAQLVPCGDAQAIEKAMMQLSSGDLARAREEVRADFAALRSYPVLARRYERLYRDAQAQQASEIRP